MSCLVSTSERNIEKTFLSWKEKKKKSGQRFKGQGASSQNRGLIIETREFNSDELRPLSQKKFI